MVSEPVRGIPVAFSSNDTGTWPVVVPPVTPNSRSHEILLAAVHEQPGFVVTRKFRVPPAAGMERFGGSTVKGHGAAVCVMLNGFPPTVITAVRLTDVAFAAT